MAVIRIYTDTSHYQPEQRRFLVDILRPFLKDAPISLEERRRLYGKWIDQVSLTESKSRADLFILPMDWKYYYVTGQLDRAKAFVEKVSKYNKPILTFDRGDDSVPVPYDHVIVLRHNIYKSRQRPNEMAIPAFFQDPLIYECGRHDVVLRGKGEKAVVGFCGQAADPLWKIAVKAGRTLWRNLLYDIGLSPYLPHSVVPGTYIRMQVLKTLEQSPFVETDFVKRKKYRGIDADRKRARQEFLENILNTDYTVCVRGAGNWSKRFYEVLSLGRIPIFIDTNSSLPFEDEIDWRTHYVFVNYKDRQKTADLLVEFHNRLDPKSLSELGRLNRKLWLDHLSFQGFHLSLINRIMNIQSS